MRGKGWAPLGTIQEEVCRWQVLRASDVQESSCGEEGPWNQGLLCCPAKNSLGPRWGGLAGSQGIGIWPYKKCFWTRGFGEVAQFEPGSKDRAAVCGGETWVRTQEVACGRGDQRDGGRHMWQVLRRCTQWEQSSQLGLITLHIVPCWNCLLPAHESQVLIFQEFSEPLVKIRRY